MVQGTVAFHFGKHKGEPIESVPADYLHWIIENQKNDFFTKNRRSVRMAQEELGRRGVNVDLPPEDEFSPIKFNEIGEKPKEPTPKIGVELPVATLNEASKCTRVLKAFVTRLDETQGLHDWIISTAKEAMKHGTPLGLSGVKQYRLGDILVTVTTEQDNYREIVGFGISPPSLEQK